VTGLDPLLVHFILAILALWPLARISRRAGLHPAWAGLVLIPVAGWPAVGTLLAFRRWPERPVDVWRAATAGRRRRKQA
jgi:hypothetical protein